MRIMRYAEELTGKGFELVRDDWLPMRASIRIARQGESTHIITYQSMFELELPYLIAHECGHLIRIYQARPEERKLPAVTRQHRRRAAHDLKHGLKRLHKKGLRDVLVNQLLSMWHDGLVQQVANTPSDMRIERWLRENYSGLRLEQERALKSQVLENYQVRSPKLRELTPQMVYNVSNTINSAFAHYMALLLGDKSFSGLYADTGYEEDGSQLAKAIWEKQDRGHVSDIEDATEWARLFNIEEWFEWYASAL